MPEEQDLILKDQLSERDAEIFVSDDNLRDFLRILKLYPAATKEENVELIKMVKAGNEEMLDLCVKKNLRLVLSVVYNMRIPYYTHQKLDLIQEGNIGLLKAIEDFDESKGAFSTFAKSKIRAEIETAIYSTDAPLRIPRYLNEDRGKYKKLVAKCKAAGEPLPSFDKICEILDISKFSLEQILKLESVTIKSLSEPISEDGDLTLGDTIVGGDAYQDIVEPMQNHEFLVSLKLSLSPKLYYILYYRVLVAKKVFQDKLANELGITSNYIGQEERRAVKKITRYYDLETHTWKFDLKDIKYADLKNYDSTPLSPRNIIKYLFVRDELSEEERVVLQAVLLSDRKDYIEKLKESLGVDSESIKRLIESSLVKMRARLQDREQFEEFRKNVIAEFKSDIFNVDLNLDIKEFLGKRK